MLEENSTKNHIKSKAAMVVVNKEDQNKITAVIRRVERELSGLHLLLRNVALRSDQQGFFEAGDLIEIREPNSTGKIETKRAEPSFRRCVVQR